MEALGDSDSVTGPDWGMMGDAQPNVGDPVDRASTLAAVRSSMFQREPAPRPTLSRHILLRPLGAGGSGIVYEAYDPELGRKVAVKLLKTSASLDAPTRDARLRREAQATAKVSHPNVIAIYDVGTYDEEDLRDVVAAPGSGASARSLPREGVFVVMELVEGTDLREWMEREHPWQTRLAIIRQAGLGLAAAHAQNLVHRDVKPDNVFVGNDGGGEGDARWRVRVLDFGLALASDPVLSGPESGSDSRESIADEDDPWPTGAHPQPLPAPDSPEKLTQSGVAVGTPAYMSPEQHMGRRADARSDQFNFCATAYELLAGHRAYPKARGDRLFELKRVGKVRAIPKNSKVPKRVWAAILRGLSPRPEDRWPTMQALLAELAPRRREWIVIAALAAVVVALPVSAALYGYAAEGECEGFDDALEDVWSDSVREDLAARIQAVLGHESDAAWHSVQERIDTYVAQWSSQRTDACRAQHAASSEKEVLAAENRISCLERRRLDLTNTLDVLRHEEGRVVERMREVVDGLRPLAKCESPEARSALLPPPGEERIEAMEILSEHRRAQVLSTIGSEERRLAVTIAALARARALGHQPTIARSLLYLAMAQWNNQDTDAALENLDEAVLLAERAGDDATVVDAMVGRASIIGKTRFEFDEAYRLLDWAEARSDDPVLRARTSWLRGVMLSNQGKPGAALEVLDRGVTLHEDGRVDQPAMHAALLNAVGSAQSALGQPEEALATFERALGVIEDSFGSGPNTAYINNNMGTVYQHLGRMEEACDRYDSAHRMFVRFFGNEHIAVAMALNNLGVCHTRRGDHRKALETHRKALRVREAAQGPEHADCAFSWVNIGDELLVLERYEEARAAHERAVEIWTAKVGPDYVYLAVPHAGLAEIALADDRLDAAREHVRLGLDVLPPGRRGDFEVRLEFVGARIEFFEDPIAARSKVAMLRRRPEVRNNPGLTKIIEQWWAEHGALELE